MKERKVPPKGTVRTSNMESCLCCGASGSSAVERNPEMLWMADQIIELAVATGNVKVLHELADYELKRTGGYTTTGGLGTPGSALYKLRRFSIARKALAAAEKIAEAEASDEVFFDKHNHVI